MKKIVLEGHISVPGEDLAAVEAELPNHISLTQSEKGCLCFSVVQRAGDPCTFDVYEEFESQAAFDLHQARVRASTWGDVSVNVSRHYVTKEVEA